MDSAKKIAKEIIKLSDELWEESGPDVEYSKAFEVALQSKLIESINNLNDTLQRVLKIIK